MKFPLKRVFSVHQESSLGGGGSYTFGNGLTESGGAVTLGDALTSPVTFTGAQNFSIGTVGSPINNFAMFSNTQFQLIRSSGAQITGTGSVLSLAFGSNLRLVGNLSDGFILTDDNGTGGIKEDSDYSSDYGPLHHVNKTYSDSFLGGNALDSTVISPGATQDKGLLSWNNSNQEFDFASDITLGAGKTGSTRTITFTGSATNVGALYLGKGNGEHLFASTGYIANSIIGDGVCRFQKVGNDLAFKAQIIVENSSSDPAGVDLDIKAADALSGNQEGGSLALLVGSGSGTGLKGSVKIQQTFKTISTTTYTIQEQDWGKRLKFTNAAGCAVTLPDGLSDGLEFAAKRHTGAGVVTFAAATTLLSSGTEITTVQDWASVVHEGSDVWHAAGLN